MSGLLPGDIAQVSGLRNAAKYNGSRGIILAESKPDQNDNLRQPIRLFNFNGKVLDARVTNLQVSHDLEKWKIPHLLNMSILELIKSKRSLAEEDNCTDFATKLWGEMAELGPRHPLTIDHGSKIRDFIMEAPGRKLYWLALDAIGHHLLVEKCDGQYRVYQAYVAQHNYGYAAAEWCFGDMRKKPAWSKWGGGKLLVDKDIGDLLDLVVKWQKLILVVLKTVLLPAVPGLNPEAIPYLQLRYGDPDSPKEMIQHSLGHISRWSQSLIKRIGPEGMTDVGVDPINRRVQPGRGDVDVLIGTPENGELIFSIPKGLYTQCDNLNREMTGEPLVPSVFLLMLNSGVWWEARRDDDGSAVGFAYRGMDLGTVISEEEGVRRAERMSQNAIDRARSLTGL